MAAADFLVAVALLLWGCRQLADGVHALLARSGGVPLRHAGRGPLAALALGCIAGVLQPSRAPRPGWVAAGPAASPGLRAERAFVVLLGAHLGAAAAMLLLTLAAAWVFHVCVLAGTAALLQTRHAAVRDAGRAVLGVGLVLLALRILDLAAGTLASQPVIQVLGQALAQDALLAAVAGGLLAAALRSPFPATLAVAATWAAWLPPTAAVAVLVGVQVGAAAMACTRSAAQADPVRQLAATHLIAVLLTAALCLVLHADLAQALGTAAASSLVLLHLGIQVLAAAAFLGVAQPLTDVVASAIPMRACAAEPAEPLQERDLELPSVALAAAVRELMRIADLVDRMLRLTRDVFTRGDAEAARAAREAEQQVDACYRSLKDYLVQIPRRALDAAEQRRWADSLAFLVAAEQVADRIERVLGDLEDKKMERAVYPSDAQADILGLHEQLAGNLRLAAGICLERGPAAARELLASKAAFRRLEQDHRAAHVARLVAGDTRAATISSLHFNLLADYVDMNDQLCAFARDFLEAHDAPGRAVPAGSRPLAPASHGGLKMNENAGGIRPQGGA